MVGFVVVHPTRADPAGTMPNAVAPSSITFAKEDMTDPAGDSPFVIREIRYYRKVPAALVEVSGLIRHLNGEDTPGARERIRPNAVVEVGASYRPAVAEVPRECEIVAPRIGRDGFERERDAHKEHGQVFDGPTPRFGLAHIERVMETHREARAVHGDPCWSRSPYLPVHGVVGGGVLRPGRPWTVEQIHLDTRDRHALIVRRPGTSDDGNGSDGTATGSDGQGNVVPLLTSDSKRDVDKGFGGDVGVEGRRDVPDGHGRAGKGCEGPVGHLHAGRPDPVVAPRVRDCGRVAERGVPGPVPVEVPAVRERIAVRIGRGDGECHGGPFSPRTRGERSDRRG